MNDQQKIIGERYQQTTNAKLYALIFLFLSLSYANSFQGEWHFDDILNIVTNNALHLEEITIESIITTFYASPQVSGKFSRPISNLSFALNWFVGENAVFGYHLINFILHFLVTLLLFKTILLIFQTPKIKRRNSNNITFIAALASVLWAMNPVQTQAVTYIVQRMAVLAAFFYLAGMYFYLQGRLVDSAQKNRRWIYYLLTLLAFLLAVGSKENAIVLPVSLMLVEIFFFNHSVQTTKRFLWMMTGGCCLVFLYLFSPDGQQFIHDILNTYKERSFTLSERLLTESRILIFYLSLLFFPSPSRLSITHDIEFSHSILSPPSTLGSILFITAIAVGVFIYRRKSPLLAFSITFFFLNHLVESTIIPLELIFEHRNYIPSLFLFLPVAILFSKLLDKYVHTPAYPACIALPVVLLIVLALATLSRNQIWLTESSLWTDALEKAPNSARPYINMAYQYSLEGNDRKVFELAYLSLDKQSPTPWKDRMRAYNVMGNVMTNIGNYEKAISYYEKALEYSKENIDILRNRSKAQWYSGRSIEALEGLKALLQKDKDDIQTLHLYGEFLISLNRLDEGMGALHQALHRRSYSATERASVYLALALAKSRHGSFDTADFFIANADAQGASPVFVALCRLENNLRSGRREDADKSIRQVLSHITWPGLQAILLQQPANRTTTPFTYPLLLDYTKYWIDNFAN